MKKEIITLEVSGGFVQLLRELQIFYRLENRAKVLPLGLVALTVFKKAEENGHKVAIVDKDNKFLKEVVWRE